MNQDQPKKSDPVWEIYPQTNLSKLGLPQLWEFRYLLHFFAMRGLRGRYRPTALGYGWILLRPLLLGLVYVLVFQFLFGIRSANIPFPLFAITGILIYLFFAGAITEITSSLFSSASIISKVYYPRLVVPLTALLTNLVDLIAGSILIVAFMAVYQVWPSSNFWLAPLCLAGFVLWTFAGGLILASVSVRRRDVTLFLPVATRVLIYAMPAVYPVSLVPAHIQPYYFLNPLAVFLQSFRWSLFGDVAPPGWSIILATVLGITLLIYGLYLFNRTESTMVDKL